MERHEDHRARDDEEELHPVTAQREPDRVALPIEVHVVRAHGRRPTSEEVIKDDRNDRERTERVKRRDSRTARRPRGDGRRNRSQLLGDRDDLVHAQIPDSSEGRWACWRASGRGWKPGPAARSIRVVAAPVATNFMHRLRTVLATVVQMFLAYVVAVPIFFLVKIHDRVRGRTPRETKKPAGTGRISS